MSTIGFDDMSSINRLLGDWENPAMLRDYS